MYTARVGIEADGNGFFHPTGRSRRSSFVIDGQAYQRSASNSVLDKALTTAQFREELITGTPGAAWADKDPALIAQ